MAKLVVLPCEDYSKENVSACVDSIFADFGGAEAFLVKGKNIFIKANLVTDLPPERHGTTHPMLVECIARRLVQAGARVVVGDSSGGAYTRAYMNNVYRVTGMTEACKASGAELNDDFGFSTVDLKGKVNRHQEIIDVFLKADAVINVCKLKTHGFTGYSCAVKNLYGLIPGLVKAEVHSKYPELDDFCDNLIDIERFASEKILLHVVDGVIGMEGEGPTNGTPRFVGKIIACDDAYITDVAAVKLFDEPSKMPLLLKAVERGLLNSDFGASCVDYSECEKAYIEDFKRVSVLHALFNKRGFLRRFLRKEWVTRKPVIKKSVCRGCEKCFRHCPRQAIEMKSDKSTQKKRAFIHSKQCIRCYCCQELCPFNAVKLKKPFLYRVMRALSVSKSKKTKKQG